MIDSIRLNVLSCNPDVEIEEIDPGAYWVRYDHRHWIVWAETSRWIEIEIGDKAKVVGDMHFGSVSTFNQKCILRVPALPANHGKKWGQSEIGRLYEHIEIGTPIETIAGQLGRSAGSIVAKAGSLLGLGFENVDTSKHLGGLTFDDVIDDLSSLRKLGVS